VSRRAALLGLTAAIAAVSLGSIGLASHRGELDDLTDLTDLTGHAGRAGYAPVRQNANGVLPQALTQAAGSSLRIRKNARLLTPTEKRDFVDALKAMKQQPSPWSGDVSVYDEFVRWHRDAFEGDPMPGQMGSAFFPWHRMLNLLFELELRKINPRLTIPYWDWAVDRSPRSYLWQPEFLGGDGDPADGFVVKTGPFRQGEWEISVFDMEDTVKIPHLTRAFGRDADVRDLPTADDDEAALSIPIYDTAPWDESSNPDQSFRRYSETGRGCPRLPPGHQLARHKMRCPDAPGMHNRVHVWVAGAFGTDPDNPGLGSMGRASAPNDPVFWLMHADMDRLWVEWQRRHGQVYLPIEGGPPGHNLNDTMWPYRDLDLDVTPRLLLDHHALGYAYDTELASG
jgi:tyrosinase